MKDIIKVTKESGIPLMGCIAFGIIDRGTNLLQIRPTTVCPLNCPFCSTDAGPFSRLHDVNFEVECDYLVEEIEKAVKIKNCEIEANIDSVGEPTSYKELEKLVKKIKNIKGIKRVSMQTNGTLLDKNKIKSLKNSGLDHINLSIHSLNKEEAKKLAGNENYDVNKIKKLAKDIADEGIGLCITPVYLPRINEEDIEEIIEFAKSIGAGLGIQKYEVYKYGRKMNKAKQQNWWKFYRQLKEWEKKHDVRLILNAKDMGIEKCHRVPEVFEKGEKSSVVIKSKGWAKNQMVGVAKDRCISINNCYAEIGDKVRIKIMETKNNIYVADLTT